MKRRYAASYDGAKKHGIGEFGSDWDAVGFAADKMLMSSAPGVLLKVYRKGAFRWKKVYEGQIGMTRITVQMKDGYRIENTSTTPRREAERKVLKAMRRHRGVFNLEATDGTTLVPMREVLFVSVEAVKEEEQ